MDPVERDTGMDKRTLIKRLKLKCNDAEFIKRSQIAAAFGWSKADSANKIVAHLKPVYGPYYDIREVADVIIQGAR